MSAAEQRDSFERWKDGIDRADSDWDEYDAYIKRVAGDFNRHLMSTPMFRSLDWRLVKAMLWVETGGDHPAWKTNPYQIGVGFDPRTPRPDVWR